MLRLIVDLHGEHVVGLAAVIGYLHTGFEKTMEQKTWWKGVTYPARVDYVSFQYNELVYVLAVEKLLQLEVPRKATWMRMALGELSRIHSHLVYLGTSALEIGAISMFWYCFRERDLVLDLFEMVTGRADAHPLLPGRRARRGHSARLLRRGAHVLRADAEGGRRVRGDPQLEQDLARADGGVGLLSAEDAIALGQTGPNLRASGVDWDLRRREPYLAYDQVDFDVPVYHGGDVYDRYKVRVDEMRESTRIVAQCIDRLEEMQGEPWIADDRKVVLPPREELHTSMESLIHHFKIVTEGYRVPEGEVYVGIESPRGESGCYLVSDGGPKPWRVKFRAPSFAALHATAACMTDAAVADLIAVVGSARRRDGGRRPVSAPETTLYDEIQEIRARYPVSRSATLPALRLAQERYGWLSPDAFREVAEALDETPAYCMSVASFYDMYHLKPVGRHLVEVCTNVSCALVGAQQVLEALQSRARRARRRDDRRRRGDAAHGRVRRAAAAGATVVAVDHRYREPVTRRGRPLDRGGAAAVAAEQFVVLAGAQDGAAASGSPTTARPAATPRSSRRGSMEPAQVVQEILDSGLRGRGGAFFPTGRKASFLAEGHGQADLPRRQRRRVRAGHLQGPRDHVHASRTG